MSETQTGGSAFHGMSLREYYAAHAPNKVPDWFRHDSPIPIPEYPKAEFPLSEDADAIKRWFRCAGFPFVKPVSISEAVLAYCDAYMKTYKARHDWVNNDQASRFFQWRWYYADMMLEQQEK